MKALEADNLKSAAAHFKEVNAEQNKKMQAAFCDKGVAFYEKGDEEKALTYFEYVTDKDLLPKIDAALLRAGVKARRRRRVRQGDRNFRKAWRI